MLPIPMPSTRQSHCTAACYRLSFCVPYSPLLCVLCPSFRSKTVIKTNSSTILQGRDYASKIKMFYWVRYNFQSFSLYTKMCEVLFHNIYREHVLLSKHNYRYESQYVFLLFKAAPESTKRFLREKKNSRISLSWCIRKEHNLKLKVSPSP